MTSEAKTLEDLAETYCKSVETRGEYLITIDQLRALIKEVVGEDVARVQIEGDTVEWNPNIELDLDVGTKLYELKVKL